MENDEGEQIRGYFYNTWTDTTIKTTKRTVFLKIGQFVHLEKGEKLTHQKYFGKTRFSKL